MTTPTSRYDSLSEALGDAAPALVDGMEVVEEQVRVLGPLEPEQDGPQ